LSKYKSETADAVLLTEGEIMPTTRVKMVPLQFVRVAVCLGILVAMQGCKQGKMVSSVGTHKVTVTRGGLATRVGVERRDNVEIFRYEGFSHYVHPYRIKIQDDRVFVNEGLRGALRDGDSVLISDEGIAVNSMDYGESKKYLQANALADSLTTASTGG
jgi:hypothetical protein